MYCIIEEKGVRIHMEKEERLEAFEKMLKAVQENY